MSTPVEEPKVGSEPKTFRDHYEATKAAQSSSPDDDQGTEAPPEEIETDDTPATPPAEDPDKVADQPQEPAETEDALLTSEEVGKLNAKERKLYEKAQKVFTQKTQAIAAERKEIEQWKPLIQSLKTDPAAAVDALAKQLGLTVTKANQDTIVQEIKDELPPELAQIFDKPLEARIQKAIDQRLKPIEDWKAAASADAAAAETKATMEAFSSKYKGWEKHEPAMLKYMQKYTPGREVTAFEFMEDAYKAVTADINKAEEAKKVVARMEKSAAAAESPTTGVADSRVEHKRPADITPENALRKAAQAAKEGVVWSD